MARLKVVEQEQHASSTGGVVVRRSPPRRCNQTPLGRALGADRSSRTRPEPIIKVRKTVTKDEQALLYGEYIKLPLARIERNEQLKKLCAKYGVSIWYPQRLKAKLVPPSPLTPSVTGDLPASLRRCHACRCRCCRTTLLV